MEVFFSLAYSVEACIKIFAIGFKPYWHSDMNKLACHTPIPPWT